MFPLHIRRVLFFIFVGIFLVSAPLVVFYTAGYRFNRTTGTVSQTSTVAIQSLPKGAAITLDETIDARETPNVLQRLSPGLHTLTLTKKGYYPWTRHIRIESGMSISITIPLFLSQEPQSVDKESAAWITAVHARENMLPTLREDLSLTTVQDRVFFTHTHGDQQDVLALLPLDTYTPIVITDDDIFLQNTSGDVFFVSSATQNAPTRVGQDVQAFAWHAPTRTFAWTDGFEASIFSADTRNATLITRQSTPLTDLVFAHQGASLLLASATTLQGVDLTPYEDGRTFTQLAEYPAHAELWFSPQGDIVYILVNEVLTAQKVTP